MHLVPRRLLLADPSIAGLGGHYFEYADAVANAAKDVGLPCEFAVNKAFPGGERSGVTIYPVFSRDFFGRLSAKAPRCRPGTGLGARFRLLRFYFGAPGRVLLALLPNREPSLANQGPLVLTLARADAPLSLSLLRRLRRRAGRLRRKWREASHRRALEAELHRWRQDRRVGKDDLLFWPTLSWTELDALMRVFPGEDRPAMALLVRRDLSEEGREAAQRALSRAKSVWGEDRLRFFTDSEGLSEEYSRLGLYRFMTLPIPHLPSPPVPRAGIHVAGFLGDAREEKGYPWLPDVVEAARDLRFLVQSNLPQGGASREVHEARLLLQTNPREIEMTLDPLGPAQYADLLHRTDLFLLPYDRVAYRNRSSGVLLEALSLGRPVVVPSGCWLSRQFAPERKAHLEKLLPRVRTVVKGPTELSGATHLFLAARAAGEMTVSLAWSDAAGNSETRTYFLDAGCPALEPLPAGASDVRVVAPSEAAVELWTLDGDPALSAVGTLLHDRTDFPGKVLEILRHASHYQDSARSCAQRIRGTHGGAALMRILLSQEGRL